MRLNGMIMDESAVDKIRSILNRLQQVGVCLLAVQFACMLLCPAVHIRHHMQGRVINRSAVVHWL